MKRLFPALFLVACNTHEASRLVGKDSTELNLGKSINVASQSYTNIGFDKYGHPRMTLRDNSEAVPIHVLDTAETVAGGYFLTEAQKAAQAADVATNKSNNARILGEKTIESKTTLGLGAQETTKAITIPK